jgi:phosphomannomutase
MKKHIFRKYDVRGIYGDDLTDDCAYKIAKAFSHILKDKGINAISIGMDGRISSPALKNAFKKGIIESGLDVFDIGLVHTPCLYFSAYHLNLGAAAMITGSHNPKEYNGIKFMIKGESFFDQDIMKMYDLIKDGIITDSVKKGKESLIDIRNEYVDRVLSDVNISKDITISWDCGNGATGEILSMILDKLPNQNHKIFDDIDGNFPNHHPDPTVEKNMKDLSDLVKSTKSDLGIGFDGDGDRIGIVDNNGNFVPGDILMCILSSDVLKHNNGAKIISDVKASKVLFDEIAKLGGKPIMWKTGHSFIKAKMRDENVLLAGEMSGHIFYADKYYGFDDGIYAALRLLDVVSKNNIKISDFIDKLPKTFSTTEDKIYVDEQKKFNIMDNITSHIKDKYKNVNDIDGVRVDLDSGWFLIRASNTQNCLIVRCESTKDQNDLNAIKDDMDKILKKFL